MWFELKNDERLKRCATDGCGGQPSWRLEASGTGSNYCSGCKTKITRPGICEDDAKVAEYYGIRII